jgi:hypothetical protein
LFSILQLMDTINVSTAPNLEINYIELQKMAFIYNAIHAGWSVSCKGESYVFTKKHEGKKEVFLDTYMKSFIENNMNIDKIIN